MPKDDETVTKGKEKKKKKVHVGDRAWMPKSPEYGKGTIRFIGPTKFKYGITWVGFELDKPVGKNSGWVKGLHYYDCKDNHGVFSPIQQVELLEGDEALPDPDDEKAEEEEEEEEEGEEEEGDEEGEEEEIKEADGGEKRVETTDKAEEVSGRQRDDNVSNEDEETVRVVLKKKTTKRKPKSKVSTTPIAMKPLPNANRKKRKTPKFAPTIEHPHLVFVPYDIDAHVYYRAFPEKLVGRVPEDKFFEILDTIENSVEHQKLSDYHDKMETGPLLKYACLYGVVSMFTFGLGVIFYWRFMDKMFKEGFASRKRLIEMLIESTSPYSETTKWRFNPLVDDLTIVISIVK